MTSKERAFLKKKAHILDPIVRIGKDGLNDGIIKSINDAIESRELIKVKILQNCEQDREEIYFKLNEIEDFEVVGITGRIITIYKENDKNPKIKLEMINLK